MFYRIAVFSITALCRALLGVEKAMVRWIAPELTEAERQHYQAIIERHEREIGQKGGAGA